jgi:beta-mannosidase
VAVIRPDEGSLDLSGRWRAAIAHGDLHQRFVEAGFDDEGWAAIEVPGHWRSTSDFAGTDGPLLYRRRFEAPAPAPGRRAFLVLEGTFYFADVWLDADYLAATEGYFFPHTLEVTEQLRAASEHTVAVEVACPRQTDRTAKRLVTGVFSHWDNLDPAWNPGGLWRPVRVRETGPVRLGRTRIICAEAGEERGRLRFDITLDAGEPREAGPRTARLVARVTGPAPHASLLAEAPRDVTLSAGDNHLQWTVDVDEPPRWWPRRLGDQPRCEVELVVEVDGEISDRHTVRTAFRELRWRRWQLQVNGEPMFLMGSNQGPTRMELGEATPEELRRDVQLAIDANLDLLRVHAHVTRTEVYDAADEAGLLLWQDFPLQWGYARGVRKPAVRQARAMVDLLGHHPSIVLWCAHNEPLAVDLQPGEPMPARKVAQTAASMFLPTWNKNVLDRSITRALHRADPSRAVDPHSGVFPGLGSPGTDAHFYFGWYHGTLDGLAPALRAVPRLARFVTEFGAQAVPETAEFMEPERWPDLDWERLFERHACQKLFFDRYVPPAQHATFDDWRRATQEYQAALVQLQVEDLRRIKGDPAGGFCHFCFADGHPAVTWSVLDHARVAKPGFFALQEACRPVLPMLEPRLGLVHVVSEARVVHHDARVVVRSGEHVLGNWQGSVAADAVTYIGRVEPERAVEEVVVSVEHPAFGTIDNRYSTCLLESVRRAVGG